MRSRDKILKKLFSKRKPTEFGFSPSELIKISNRLLGINDLVEKTNEIELDIGVNGILSVAIISSGDEQFLIRIYLKKPDQPKVTILYDQCQFSNLDRVVHRLCKSGIYLYG